jgi:pre-mRNA-splicing factor SYF1
MRMAGFERLLERRPLLLNAVLLRQNPHNVAEWHTRVGVLEEMGDFRRVVDTYKEALRIVDPFQVPGVRFGQRARTIRPGPHSLWIGFARFYDRHGLLKAARKVYERATLAKHGSLAQLAAVWADYAECELGHRHYRRALTLLQRALEVPVQFEKIGTSGHIDHSGGNKSGGKGGASLQAQLFRSTRLWHLLADLEESVGSFDSTCAVYERMLDVKVATPQTIINYAHYLEGHRYFEDSFRAYERGVSLFQWPYVGEIWRFYLHKFGERYGGQKLERSRDLFEQCLEGAPPSHCKLILLMYAELEERHGLARHALAIYDRACRQVSPDDQPQLYQIYLGRATDLFGVTRTREIFEKAVASLRHDQVPDMCVQFAAIETNLGEVDRARSILAHGSQVWWKVGRWGREEVEEEVEGEVGGRGARGRVWWWGSVGD